MKESNNIKTIIASAVVTGIITVLTTLGINHFTSKSNKLTYATQTSIPFQKDSLNVKILNIDLFNDGDEPVEDIYGLIQFNMEQISDYKVKALPTLTYRESIEKNTFKISITSLNPSEKVSVSFLLSSSGSLDSIPKINFRAKGIFAEEKEESKSEDKPSGLYRLILIAATLSVFLSSLLLPFFRKYLKKAISISDDDDDIKDGEQHFAEQNKILAYLCGVHGLTSEINRYLDLKTEVSYWSEADYFGNLALLQSGHADNNKRLLVLLDLLNYAQVAEESKGIVYYNIAKIYKALNDSSKTKEFLDKAQKIIPLRVKQRLTIDKNLSP